MQDKYPNNYDPDFTQKAWEHMRGLLDEELPERRKPIFWWIFSGVALVLLLTGAIAVYGWWMGEPSLPPMPVASNTTNSKTPEQVAERCEEGKEVPALVALPSVFVEQAEQLVVSVQTDALPSLVKHINEGGEPPHDIQIAPIKGATPAIALLDALPTRTATQFERVETSPTATIPTLKAPKRWELAAVVGLHNPLFLRPQGLSFDFSWAYRFRDSRWALETGLGYYSTDWDKSSDDFALSGLRLGSAEDESANFDDTLWVEPISAVDFNPGKYASNVGGKTFYPGRLHYLTLPLGAQWQASPRWRLRMGAQLRWLIWNENTDLTGQYSEANGFDILENDPALYYSVRQFGLAAYGGVQFQMTPRFSMQANYFQGLLDRHPTQSGAQRFGSVQLALRYAFVH